MCYSSLTKNTATYEYHEEFLNENSLDEGEKNGELNEQIRKKLLASDRLYSQLITMLNAGKINEAENLLFDKLDEDEDGFLKLHWDFMNI